ncbi:MAG: (d)CMP kinase [Blautia sp.]|nr:(d)CMP kinase [Blautia sp.]
MGKKIAIDGPAGAGKSTIARLVAGKLSFIYVDTGAMYRAIALYFIRQGADGSDTGMIKEKCREAEVSIRYENQEQEVYLNGERVTPFLRTGEVSRMASCCSAVAEVRSHLLDLQRGLAREYNVVMDGRDIGTTILPDAEVKIFLTASVEVRAKRRYLELLEKGEPCDLEQIKAEISERDERDRTRAASPLVKAEDAILVDSSDMTIDETANKILEIVLEQMGCK